MKPRSCVERYFTDGYIVIEDVLSRSEVATLRGVTDDFVERSRSVSESNDVFDLEPSHSSLDPRLRRIKSPHLQHRAYADLVAHPAILEVLRPLLGHAIKFDQSKLNIKAPRGGSAVEWHQDWAFYPATNDDLCAVGIMLDDCRLENGPLMVLPGTHKGPIYDHHSNGSFCGAIDPTRVTLDFDSAVPLLGRSGSISVHHVRTVHGSAPNRSDRSRRLLLFQYRAADAWSLIPHNLMTGRSFEAYAKQSLICGDFDPITPRMKAVPVRLPLPEADHRGSIFEEQRGRTASYFID